MPKWIPGKEKGKNVAVQFTLPIRFTLQEEDDAVEENKDAGKVSHNEIFTVVDQPPTFPGGEEALARYLNKNIHYPAAAQKANTSGTVFVQFVVRSNGNISDIHTVGAVKGNGLEDEAIGVIKKMPRWNAGHQNNRPVDVQFNLPIRFSLQQ